MGNDVFANGREVACKAADGKAIAAFPDVAFTPPQTPATPPGVPIPYPNTAMASDTTKGSKKVKISGKEVMLKNQSYFKTSTGDEAGAAPKKGVVTSKTKGKVYFNMWSMDVKFEGQNVVRHLDMTTHNHGSMPPNSPTWPYLDAMAAPGQPKGPCDDVAKEVNTHCTPLLVRDKTPDKKIKRTESIQEMCRPKNKACKNALKCVLSPKDPSNCCPQPQPSPPKSTPHHVVPDSQFNDQDGKRLSLKSGGEYNYNKAPCICASGVSHSTGLHGKIHTATNNATVNHPTVRPNVSGKTISGDARWTVAEAEDVGANAVAQKTKCDPDCIKAQVRNGHEQMNIKKDDLIRPTTAGKVSKPPKPPTTGPSML